MRRASAVRRSPRDNIWLNCRVHRVVRAALCALTPSGKRRRPAAYRRCRPPESGRMLVMSAAVLC